LPGKKQLVPAAILTLVIFLSAYIIAINAFQKESDEDTILFQAGDTDIPDRVDMDVNVLYIDPVREELLLRITLIPQGKLCNGFSCLSSLRLVTPGATRARGLGEVIPEGTTLDPLDLSYVLDGQVNDYPFDGHNVSLIYYLSQIDPEKAIPSTMTVRGNVPGYRVEMTPDNDLPQGFHALDMTIVRSSTVMNAALAGMAVMWAIGLGVSALIVLHLIGWYNVRMPAFFAALLFGLFSLRNSMPGTPPIGTYSDFLAFLWVEGIVALALVVSLVATLKNRPA
jgi:hypothetical protein